MRLHEFTAGRSPRDDKLIPVGYWYSDREPELPMPDSNESMEHEEEIARYLRSHKEINRYRGSSTCRICGDRRNGSTELSDGTYIWPQGLAHYVEEHKTTLPAEFIEHILANPAEVNPEAEEQAAYVRRRQAQRRKEREERRGKHED